MTFKEWLQQEIKLDLSTPLDTVQNPTAVKAATDGIAKATMAKFGPKVVDDVAGAPSNKAALKDTTKFAKMMMNKTQNDPAKSSTNVGAVGAKVFQMATGEQPKTT